MGQHGHMRGAVQTQPAEASRPESRSTSPLMRVVLLVVGSAALALGVIGIFLPVLPTTPFLLVAAACFARSSERLYAWLLGQPSLGPIITTWQDSRSLPPGVKPRALAVVAVTFGISILLVDALLLRAGLLGVALVLTVFLYRLPTAPDDPEARQELPR